MNIRIFIYINKKIKTTMGCGCKNKGTVSQPQQPLPQQLNKPNTQTESIQSAIKKTVQKYYNQKK